MKREKRRGKTTANNKALSARGTAGGKALEYHQVVILPTCLSLTESVAALAHEVSLGMSGFPVRLRRVVSARRYIKSHAKSVGRV
jgi:hypothetical protein